MFFRVYPTIHHSGLQLGRLLFILLLAVGQAQAQAPGTGGPAPAPAAVPLDGGASLLLLAGAAYGLRRLRRVPR